MGLVHHVCQLTRGLESLFLIYKSSCAFANYADESHRLVAQQALHSSYYRTSRLVSRLRGNSGEGGQGDGTAAPAALVAPAAEAGSEAAELPHEIQEAADMTDHCNTPVRRSTHPEAHTSGADTTQRSREDAKSSFSPTDKSGTTQNGERYFILKSLSVEDLEESVRTGVWATQSRNEEILNDAFKVRSRTKRRVPYNPMPCSFEKKILRIIHILSLTFRVQLTSCSRQAGDVYLIFSANKSGEYFGYARMTSEINQDPAAAIAFAPSSKSSLGADPYQLVLTEATETTPCGQVVFDYARGTIFWEKTETRGTAEGSADGTSVTDSEPAKSGEITSPSDDCGLSGADAEGGDTSTAQRKTADFSASAVTGESQAWGKPFKLEWLSTQRVPFARTRGLRNPLNANREIKIARDGTDVDVAVGRRLIRIFHEEQKGNSTAMVG